MAEREIDDARIAAFCGVLVDHGVEFVVIGGVAARLHDTGHATVDIDVCPSSVEENLERLAEALRSIGARLRVEGVPEGIPFDPHPQQLRQMATRARFVTLRVIEEATRSVPLDHDAGPPAISSRVESESIWLRSGVVGGEGRGRHRPRAFSRRCDRRLSGPCGQARRRSSSAVT